jgi:hypothetical protein
LAPFVVGVDGGGDQQDDDCGEKELHGKARAQGSGITQDCAASLHKHTVREYPTLNGLWSVGSDPHAIPF